MSDPNVISLFLTLTEPTPVKANYRLKKSQKTLPTATANKLQHRYTRWWPPTTEVCADLSWAVGPSIHRGKETSRVELAVGTLWQEAAGFISSQRTEVLCLILADTGIGFRSWFIDRVHVAAWDRISRSSAELTRGDMC